MEARQIVAQWIDRQREERNADALAWCFQRSALGLLACYPREQGRELLWALVRRVVGPEVEGEQGRLLMKEEG